MINEQAKTVLSAVSATGASEKVACRYVNKTLQVIGTFVGTIHLEGSNDGVNFTSLGNVTAAGKINNTETWIFVRANVTAYTSGTITAILSLGE